MLHHKHNYNILIVEHFVTNIFYLAGMTLEKAFEELTKTEEFKAIAKKKTSLGAKHRIYLTRYKAGKLKAGAISEMLLASGYTISANKATKIKW